MRFVHLFLYICVALAGHDHDGHVDLDEFDLRKMFVDLKNQALGLMIQVRVKRVESK